MPIQGITLKVGATDVEATNGGTATAFETDDVRVNNGIHVSDPTTAFTSRPGISYRSRPPVLQPDGSWSKAKRLITVTIPYTLADGSTSFQVFRSEGEFHPEYSNADVKALVLLGAQAWYSAEAQDFVLAGSLA